ncbi:hypothetical protein PAMC26577_08560 [Caballeronia sordidicola]|uniref:Uncharacterized protein n=1 Tax=Caballeronia sordidicola TaxID=196367 RepID=A0A242N0U4_CABSO|nr:hypothetical protein PAMC26577_08560 [Caballeronia sordidicola]
MRSMLRPGITPVSDLKQFKDAPHADAPRVSPAARSMRQAAILFQSACGKTSIKAKTIMPSRSSR